MSVAPPPAIRSAPVPTCPLCATSGRVRHDEVTDRLFGVPGTWSYRECPACTHLWLDPRPAAEDVPRLYAEYHTHGHGQEGQDSPDGRAGHGTDQRDGTWLENAVLASRYGYSALATGRVQRAAGRVASAVPPVRRFVEMGVLTLAAPTGRLLDVGSGDGTFLVRMRALGWEVEGLEPDPRAAAVAAARHGLRVHAGTLEQHGLPEARYDAVTLNHVVEHVADPVAALATAARLARPGGRVVAVTPNGDSLGHARYGPAWRGLEPPRHFHVLRASTLRSVAERAGLRIERIDASGRSARFIVHESERLAGRTPDLRSRVRGVLWQAAEETVARDRGEELVLVARR